MPNLQNDDFTLVGRELGESFDGGTLNRGVAWGWLKPAGTFPFPKHAAEQATTVIERPIPEGPDQVMVRLSGGQFQAEQTPKRIMQNVFRFGMTEPERAAVQHHLGRALVVKSRGPVGAWQFRWIDAVRGHFIR